MKYLKDNDLLSFLGKSHDYYNLTVNELFDRDPKYLLWITKNCAAFKFSDGIRSKLKKWRKENNIIIKRGQNVFI